MNAIMQTNDAAAAERAGCYALLGKLLAAPPAPELLAHLAALDVDPVQPETASWHALKLAAAHAAPQRLTDEYQDLFIGVGRGELVPYASWYLTGFLMEKPLLLLRRRLDELGFVRQASVREPEDHAAALCEVMAMLIGEGRSEAVQKEFFAAHLAPWIGRFFDDLSRAEGARFYVSVGRFGQAFTVLETDYLGVETKPEPVPPRLAAKPATTTHVLEEKS